MKRAAVLKEENTSFAQFVSRGYGNVSILLIGPLSFEKHIALLKPNRGSHLAAKWA